MFVTCSRPGGYRMLTKWLLYLQFNINIHRQAAYKIPTTLTAKSIILLHGALRISVETP
jgi:hypothetical protein